MVAGIAVTVGGLMAVELAVSDAQGASLGPFGWDTTPLSAEIALVTAGTGAAPSPL
jgi:hypothetical protein